MPKVKSNGININYLEKGEGDVVLFIPGLGGDKKLFYYQIPYFSEHYRVIVMDNRGAGLSDKPEEPYTMKIMADDVKGLLDALEINEPINLVAVSLGGIVSQRFIHEYPDMVKKLVIVSSGLSGADPNYVPMSDEVAAKIMYPGNTIEEKVDTILNYYYHSDFVKENPYLRDMFIKGSLEKQKAGIKVMYDQQLAAAQDPEPYYEWLSDIKCPVLVMHGDGDRIWPVENAKVLKRGIGDKCELFIIENSEHMILQSKAAEFNKKLHEFLKK